MDHGGLLNLDLAEQAAAVASHFRPEDLLEMFELFSAAQEAINYNINKRLTLEALFLSLRARARGDAAGLRSSFQAFGSTLLPAAGNLSVRL